MWTEFYFEGNLAWGIISNLNDWKRIKQAYKNTSIDLSRARRNDNRPYPAFGFYMEYQSKEILKDFAKKHNLAI